MTYLFYSYSNQFHQHAHLIMHFWFYYRLLPATDKPYCTERPWNSTKRLFNSLIRLYTLTSTKSPTSISIDSTSGTQSIPQENEEISIPPALETPPDASCRFSCSSPSNNAFRYRRSKNKKPLPRPQGTQGWLGEAHGNRQHTIVWKALRGRRG